MPSIPKKVLFVITKSNWGGAQRYVYNLATALPKDAFLASVALGGTGTPGSAPGELAERLASARIETHAVASFGRNVSLLHDIATLWELVRLFRREHPDIVHLNSSKAGGVGALAARLAGVPRIVFTSHGLAWEEDRTAWQTRLIKLASWLTFALCHHIIVISKENFQQASSLPLCKKRVTLIYNGLPSLQFESRERARLSLAVRVGLTQEGAAGALWVGTVAELTKNKGIPYLVGAAKLLADAGHAFHLFILGGGEQEEMLRALILENNLDQRVHFVGFIADAYRYDRAFDIFALASVKEGLPTVLLEAGQAGVAVIASDISGVRDIIVDGDSGLLFPSKDSEALAHTLAELMASPQKRAEIGTTLTQTVCQNFSLKQMVEETIKLY